MQVLAVTNTTIDTNTETLPFVPNNDLVAFNSSGGSLTLQQSVDGATWTTLQVLTAGQFANISIADQYVRVSTAATIYLLGN
jgi:hypothetical protein